MYLKFIPKPEQLPIQALHTDTIRNFMHKLKTKYELQTTTRLKKKDIKLKDIELKDPFTPKRNCKFNPERLPDNGTLDTFSHQVRLEMLNTDKYKQN